MTIAARSAVFVLGCALGVSGAPAGDLVSSLPGLDALKSRLFSGYLNAGPGQKLHYVYSEAISADPATAPLTAWYNGGCVPATSAPHS